MNRVVKVLAPLCAASLALASCSGGMKEMTGRQDSGQEGSAEGGGEPQMNVDEDVSSTLDATAAAGECQTEVSIKALWDNFDDTFLGVSRSPSYDRKDDDSWSMFYDGPDTQYQFITAYLLPEEIGETCPQDLKDAADRYREYLIQDFHRQADEQGAPHEEYVESDFTADRRYFSCSLVSHDDLRQYHCTTILGNATVQLVMSRHSKGESQDRLDIEKAGAVLTSTLDGMPVGPGLSDI